MNERQRMAGMVAMVFCACLAVGCDAKKSSQGDSASHDMTLMSYNVMHCAGVDDKVNIARTAEVITRENPRFAGLQELDCRAAKRSFMTILSDTKGRTFHDFKPNDPATPYCIDYIAVDSLFASRIVVRDSHVVPDVTTSDHSPVVATISVAVQ